MLCQTHAALLVASSVFAAQAHAQVQPSPVPGAGASRALVERNSDAFDVDSASRPPPLDLTITSELGAAFYSGADRDGAAPDGLLFGGTALMRMGMVGVGASAVANGRLAFSPSKASDYSLLLGLSSRSAEGMHLDLLGSLGWRAYTGWGGAGLGSDSTFKGVSASVPYAGARLRIAYVFSRHRRTHFVLGGQLGWDYDLETRQVRTSDSEIGAEARTVGGNRMMVGLVIGFVFDIGGRVHSPLQ